MQNQSKESPRPRYLRGMAIALHMRKVSSRPQSSSFLGHAVLKRGVHYKFSHGPLGTRFYPYCGLSAWRKVWSFLVKYSVCFLAVLVFQNKVTEKYTN